MDRFELEGITYYQQGRTCGKDNCRCATGDLHGPYWFARDRTTGEVDYIGKHLPPEVATARLNHEYLFAEMVEKRRELITQADALARLIRNEPLTQEDREIIENLGLGEALVLDRRSAATQDESAEQLSLV